MTKTQDQPADAAAELRRRAEERLTRQRPAGGGQTTAVETARLVHELQVHQIELEMQNEELKTSRTEVEAGLALYSDLYDFAPTGYLTLDSEGAIRRVNVTGARLFGVDRSRLVNRRFGLFVTEGDRRTFSDFLQRVFASQAKESCEVTLPQNGSQALVLQIEGTRSVDGQECRAVVLDITERERAEDALRERMKEITCLHAVGRCVQEDLTVDELCRRTVEILIPAMQFPEVTVPVVELGDKRYTSGNHTEGLSHNLHSEIRLQGKAVGHLRVFYLEERPFLIPYEQDMVNDVAAIVSTWLERKRAEETVRESEQRFRSLFDSSHDAVMTLEPPSWKFASGNPACVAMFGARDEKHFTSLGPWGLSPERQPDGRISAEKGREMIETALREGSHSFEWMHRRISGEVFPATVLLSKTQSGSKVFLQATVRDVTEWKRAQEARKEQTKLDRLVLDVDRAFANRETLPAALQECCEALVRSLNAVFARIWTLKESATVLELQASAGLYTHVDGPHRHIPVGQHKIGLIASERQPHLSNHVVGDPQVPDHEWAKREGLVAFAGHPLLLQNRVVGVVALFARHPLSQVAQTGLSLIANEIAAGVERNWAKEEKATLESQLQQAQKMESVGRLAGGVAHDFNNMLGVILGNTELALEQVDPTQLLHAYLMEIRNAAVRSADLTHQLLAFARKQPVVPKVLNLNETVAGVLTMLQRLIGEDIDLTWQPGADLWSVRVDPAQIDQILANLCVNARDAISGVGKMTIETNNSTVDKKDCAAHAGFVPGEYVRLTASDNGCGMDEDTLAHLFEPFFTTKSVGQGTGLGLATVYGAVKQNNGFICVDSKLGQGTTFTIYLPRHEGKGEQARTEGVTESASRGHETILLVEDEPAILLVTTRMLKHQGYHVLAASTPGEAIRLAREHAGEIQLLMTDVVMPEMNGWVLAKNLLSLYPHLKRLFMSGYTANIIAHDGVLEGGVSFIEKPFSVTDLAVKVRETLDSE